MNTTNILHQINAQAITPDQLMFYVSAVSSVESELVGDYVVHWQGNACVIVGYNLENPHDTSRLDDIINYVIKKEAQSITVLAPIRPKSAPQDAISSKEDAYWFLSLPFEKPSDKLKNMLTRAEKDVYISQKSGESAWTGAHQELMLNYISNKGMEPALCSILQGIEKYLLSSSQVEIFSAYEQKTGTLLACSIADFSSFSSAFYMFAFRQEQCKVPGVADIVLFALLEEAKKRGYSQCNLGLGINDGIRFFKKKWGAKPSLAFVQTQWKVSGKNTKKSFFSKFFD